MRASMIARSTGVVAAFPDEARLDIPNLPAGTTPVEEETVAGLEGSMAEWTTRLQALLQKESTKRMDPAGGDAPCPCSTFCFCCKTCSHAKK